MGPAVDVAFGLTQRVSPELVRVLTADQQSAPAQQSSPLIVLSCVGNTLPRSTGMLGHRHFSWTPLRPVSAPRLVPRPTARKGRCAICTTLGADRCELAFRRLRATLLTAAMRGTNGYDQAGHVLPLPCEESSCIAPAPGTAAMMGPQPAPWPVSGTRRAPVCRHAGQAFGPGVARQPGLSHQARWRRPRPRARRARAERRAAPGRGSAGPGRASALSRPRSRGGRFAEPRSACPA
jgi:hypothetical protein